jgi:hypothetical protein
VADRKPFLLRIDSSVLAGVQRWANDDLRSLNAQIEYLLRDALRRAGRFTPGRVEGAPGAPAGSPPSTDPPADPDPLTDT